MQDHKLVTLKRPIMVQCERGDGTFYTVSAVTVESVETLGLTHFVTQVGTLAKDGQRMEHKPKYNGTVQVQGASVDYGMVDVPESNIDGVQYL